MTGLRPLSVFASIAIWGSAQACKDNKEPRIAAPMSELWEAPTDLEQRDLFYGPGGSALAPDSTARFTFQAMKDHGRNPGYTVVDDRGREWSVKLGVESRVEVTVSRIVWAVGYHQPPVYHLRRWTLTKDGKDTAEQPGRFRLQDKKMKEESDWSWRENPFIGTRQFSGLFALMIIVNNWDLKADQNVIYQETDKKNARRRYVVRDLGASFGQSGWLDHTKDDPDGFDKEPFITGMDDSLVTFGFRQSWRDPAGQDVVRPADLRWICGLLQRLSEKQWHDAFRAGGFSKAEADRYIRRLKQKIAEGLVIGS
jgi:hypothetical protein